MTTSPNDEIPKWALESKADMSLELDLTVNAAEGNPSTAMNKSCWAEFKGDPLLKLGNLRDLTSSMDEAGMVRKEPYAPLIDEAKGLQHQWNRKTSVCGGGKSWRL